MPKGYQKIGKKYPINKRMKYCFFVLNEFIGFSQCLIFSRIIVTFLKILVSKKNHGYKSETANSITQEILEFN